MFPPAARFNLAGSPDVYSVSNSKRQRGDKIAVLPARPSD
jgi:hypothetical protein